MVAFGLSIGILSIAVIAHQLFLIQILSTIQWYYFGFMVISIALLGFGASGTLLFVLRRFLVRRMDVWLPCFVGLTSVSILVTHVLCQHISFDPYVLLWHTRQFGVLLGFYVLSFIPFFFGAAAIGLVFVSCTEFIGRLYFANLLGSGLGGVLALVTLHWIEPQWLPIVSSSVALCALVPLLGAFGLSRGLLGWMVVSLLGLGLFWALPPQLAVSEYKSVSKALQLPQAEVVLQQPSTFGFLQAVRSPALRYAPGVSLNYDGPIPAQVGVFNNGEWVGTVPTPQGEIATGFRSHSMSVLPYLLVENPKVFVVGVGTGSEISVAVQQNVESIRGVELNSRLVEWMMGPFASGTGELFSREGVRVKTGDARSELWRFGQYNYDVIVLPMLEGFVSGAAGMSALAENFLLTVESFELILHRLEPGGVFAVSSWIRSPLRGSLKLLATMMAAAQHNAIRRFSDHLMIVRSWNTVTFLFSNTPLSQQHVNTVSAFCDDQAFDLVFSPQGWIEPQKQRHVGDGTFRTALQQLVDGGETFFDTYRFHVRPATDNRPYFGHFFKWGSLGYMFDALGRQSVSFLEWGYVILMVTLIQTLVLSLVLIFVPLLLVSLPQHVVPMAWFRALGYFAALGLGFMFVEMVLIQKLVLFLGHPTYSIAAVITGLLLFSGIGSLCSGWVTLWFRHARMVVALGIIAVLLIVGIWVFPNLAEMYRLPLGLRYGVVMVLIAPLAFLMGMPFPMGLRALWVHQAGVVPWAWGVNGFFSVISTGLATWIAVEHGFVAIILGAVLCYAVVAVVRPTKPEE